MNTNNIVYVIIDLTDQDGLPEVKEVNTMAQDSATIISWKVDSDKYTAYNIERRKVGETEYEKINEMPIVPAVAENAESDFTFYPDSLGDNTTEYEYRIIGISSFGIEGTPSEVVISKGEPEPLVTDLSLDTIIESDESMVLEWTMDSEYETKILGLDVYRSHKMNGNFEKINTSILSPSTRSFTDNSPLSSNYYQIILIDENQKIQNSLPRLAQKADTIPPNPPTGVVGLCDKNGKIVVTWSKNTEDDLDGYEVFMSNSSEEEFAQLTTKPEMDTSFTSIVREKKVKKL